jgi:hypothetical protein
MKISDFDAIKKFPFQRSDKSTNEVRLRELDWLIPQISRHGLNLEFGVFSGETINHMANLRPDLKFTGFDSFEGLPEDFDAGEKIVPANAFDRGGKLPEVEDNVTLVKGWFDDTLQLWVDEQLLHQLPNKPYISFVNMDADIYSSTSYVLNTINDFIKPGTVIRFDELSCWRYVFSEASSKNIQRVYYTNWKAHEWKAMNEWLEQYDRKVIPICRNWHQAATVVVTQ